MGLFSFLVLVVIAYLIWRISDQLPDVLYRLSEIQKDIAELNRRSSESTTETIADKTKPATKKKPKAED
ncbi:MAG: hypothetical protein ACI8RT_000890 [Candidatus Azotimanducaceae bacterium]|jgi:hypothetical protein|tara:strand:- start:3370 stop:3576 length:207 start_codon:yes stop_codon:yes gene_type:complete